MYEQENLSCAWSLQGVELHGSLWGTRDMNIEEGSMLM